MKVKIKSSVVSGKIKAPASKSMAHRLLICAGLCRGESVIDNVAYSQDILATLDCLEALGATVTKKESSVAVKGIEPNSFFDGSFQCRESGSTLRFFIPIAMLGKGKSTFFGSERLLERPMEIYEDLAKEKNLFYEKRGDSIVVSGVLEGGEYSLRGDVSSQFVTGLLFALPLCEKDSRLILTGKAESTAYIDMTLEALKTFGIKVKKENANTFFIKGSQKYEPQRVTVEGDYSNAAFLDAFNYLGGNVSVSGLNADSLQGDRVYKEYFDLLRDGTPSLDVSHCPDLAPILMTLACCFNGAKLIGTRRLKIKESDRGESMKEELSKFGAVIENSENEILISKSTLHSPTQALDGHNDHRVVMSLAVLCSKYCGEIEAAQAVSKSYPDFFQRVKELGLEVDIYDN